MYNEKSFIHIEDLSHLGLEVIEEDKQYTITSSVALGVERKLVIKIGYSLEFITTGDDDIIIFKANWSF